MAADLSAHSLRRVRPPNRRGQHLPGACTLLGAVLVVIALAAMQDERPPATPFGTVPHGVDASSSVMAHPFSSTTAGATTPGALPTLLRIRAVSVTASVEPVVTRHGVLGLPADVTRVGWWTGSALPGALTGTVVVAGLVDSATTGTGALLHLTDLTTDDQVEVITRDARTITYRVDARRIYAKSRILPDSLFVPGGPARLVLITSGGPFDASTRTYRDNVVVFAHPA